MRKTQLALALTALMSLGLAACGDPDRQRGDPNRPAQEAPATEREARQQDVRDERSVNEELDREGLDAAVDPDTQPIPARNDYHRPDLISYDISDLGNLDDPTTVRTHHQEHTELLASIRDAIHNEADEVAHCAAVPFGHKACGGPASYLVYSQRDMSSSDIEDFEQQVARYNQLDAFLTISEGRMSTCDITPRPELELENGRCIANTRGSIQVSDLQ